MTKFFLTLIFISLGYLSNAQAPNYKYSIGAGYGHYDGFWIGAGKYIKKEFRINVATGFHNSFSHKQFSASASAYKKLIKLNKEKLALGLLTRVIYWNYEDEYFIFKSVAFEPALELSLSFSSKYSLLINSGPVFNMQLKSERKNFQTLGWPNKTGYNFTLGLTKKFNLKNRHKD